MEPAALVPSPPKKKRVEGLKVLKASQKDGAVMIYWNPVPGAQGYHVYVASDGKTFKKITKKPLKKTSAKLGKMKPGASYSVRLASVRDGKTSPLGPAVKVFSKK